MRTHGKMTDSLSTFVRIDGKPVALVHQQELARIRARRRRSEAGTPAGGQQLRSPRAGADSITLSIARTPSGPACPTPPPAALF